MGKMCYNFVGLDLDPVFYPTANRLEKKQKMLKERWEKMDKFLEKKQKTLTRDAEKSRSLQGEYKKGKAIRETYKRESFRWWDDECDENLRIRD